MKKTNKKQAAAWLLSLLPLAMIAAVYRRLPAEVPMHWDLDGAVDYGAKAQLWVIAAMAPVLEAMFCFLPKIDPKNKNYGKFGDAYLGIQLVTLLFLAAITGICITEALRPGTVNVSGVVCLLVSLMMVYLGNVMPRFRMNWYCGVKNPWTLSSEAVWTRTHRIAGRMFFASGLLGAAGAFREVCDAVRTARARGNRSNRFQLENLPRGAGKMTKRGAARRTKKPAQTVPRQVYL